MSSRIERVEFSWKDHKQKLVSNFDCGQEPFALEVASWIKSPPNKLESAARMLNRKQVEKVWLFLEDRNLIGFTSIGKDTWGFESSGKKKKVLLLPYLGVSVDFHGEKKKNPETNRSYMRHLMLDVLNEAEKARQCEGPIFMFARPQGERRRNQNL